MDEEHDRTSDLLASGKPTPCVRSGNGAQVRDSLARQKRLLTGHQPRGFAALVGKSLPLQAVIARACRVIHSPISILIQGETGTGKECLARAIHEEGGRCDGPFIPVNCAALSPTLLESELFGHRRGAFSGADTNKPGLLEDADRGTVFLDEVGEIPRSLQARLLRFLQDGEIRPVGATVSRHVDVRIIAATNRDLALEVKAQRFREDLYFRVAAFQLTLPPLRERHEDIPALAFHFLQHASARERKPITAIPEDVLQVLSRYHFPGNVRQLANEIACAVLFADGSQLELEHFSEAIQATSIALQNPARHPLSLKKRMREFERTQIEDALRQAKGDRTQAAGLLGITPRWLFQRMHDFGLH
jgi:transcriptional regulator with PAS, ATPase and Fis domain